MPPDPDRGRLQQARAAYAAGHIDEAVRLLEEETAEAAHSRSPEALGAALSAAEEMARYARVDVQRRLREAVGTREPTATRSLEFVGWAKRCAWVFGVAATVTLALGVSAFVVELRTGRVGPAVVGLFLGLLGAVVWISFAVALVMLREILVRVRARQPS